MLFVASTTSAHRRLVGILLALAGATTLAAAPAHSASLGKEDIKCVSKMTKQARTVAKTQNKEAANCLQNAAKGKIASARDCIDNDASGKLGIQAAKTTAFAGALCGSLPAYGFAGATELNTAAIAEELALVDDILGDDLDAAIASGATETRGTKCQKNVMKAWGKLSQTGIKLYEKCQKLGFKSSTNPIESASGLEACVNELATDPSGKFAKLASKIDKAVSSVCADQDFGAMFPGDCPGNGFSDCVTERVLCRTCRMIGQFAGTEPDCDTIDDAATNESCENLGDPGPDPEPETDALVVRFSKTSEWIGGYNARLRVINYSAPVTSGWTLEFDLEDPIDGAPWGGGILDSYADGHYAFSNTGSSVFLPTETWIDIQFTTSSTGTFEPAACEFNGSACEFEMDLDGTLPDPVFPSVPDTEPLPETGLSSWLTQAEFDQIFPCADGAGFAPNGTNCSICMRDIQGEIIPFAPDGKPMYTYRGLLEVVEFIKEQDLTDLLAFANVGDSVRNRQELAAFFANVTQETGTWDSEDGQNCGLTLWEELACKETETTCAGSYGPDMDCSASTGYYGEPVGEFCCAQTGDARDCQYWGRGPIQLSWNDNYRDLDQLLGLDNALLHNPYLLTSFNRDFVPPEIAAKLPTLRGMVWLSVVSYWMHTRDFGGTDYIPSAHMLFHNPELYGDCIPAGSSGFAQTINNVNGNQECGTNTNAKMLNRVAQYERISTILGVPEVPGEHRCGEAITTEFQMPWQKAVCPIPAPPNSACYPSPCVHGNCADNAGVAICTCESGWSGELCDVSD